MVGRWFLAPKIGVRIPVGQHSDILPRMSEAFRSKEMRDAYKAHLASGVLERSCVLCDREPIVAFNHWKIIVNNFPYDLIAEVHHMIVPLRHVTEKDLSPEEWEEYKQIKAEKLQDYEYIIEASNRQKSIPNHFHLHLIESKK